MAITESSNEAKAKCTFAKVSLGSYFSSVGILVGNVWIHATRFYAAFGFLPEEYKAEIGHMVGGKIVNEVPLKNPQQAYWNAMRIASRNSAGVEVL